MPPLDVDAALARDLAASLRHREAEFGLRPLDHDSRSPSRSPLDERIPALDGIRGVAVLLVVLVHTGLLAWGWIGVDLFFALSGFLITGILLEAKAAGGAGWDDYFKPFYLRRALRILPLAYAAMLIVLPFAPIVGLGTPAPTREVMWFVAYVSNWRIWPRGSISWQLNHFWSLAVEEQFYLLWPLVVSVLDARRLRYVCAIFLIAAPALRCVVAVLGYSTSYGHLFENITPLRMDALAAGSLLAALRYTGDFDLWAKRAPLGLAAGAIGFAAVQRSMLP